MIWKTIENCVQILDSLFCKFSKRKKLNSWYFGHLKPIDGITFGKLDLLCTFSLIGLLFSHAVVGLRWVNGSIYTCGKFVGLRTALDHWRNNKFWKLDLLCSLSRSVCLPQLNKLHNFMHGYCIRIGPHQKKIYKWGKTIK